MTLSLTARRRRHAIYRHECALSFARQSNAVLSQGVGDGAQELGPLLQVFLQMGMVRAPISEVVWGKARGCLFGKVIRPVISKCKVPGLVNLNLVTWLLTFTRMRVLSARGHKWTAWWISKQDHSWAYYS